VSQRYRQLEGGEPPRALDRAILAAARRSGERSHARWYFGLAAMAVLVLAVGIALHLDSEERAPARLERPSAPASAQVPQAPAASPVESARFAEDAARSEARTADSARTTAAAVDSPERWMERIVRLRKEGKHEEADRQLADFRKRYPDYRIPAGALPQDRVRP
jgi:hypothetical protein